MAEAHRDYFTVVFKGDIGKFKTNPMLMKTDFGEVAAAGRGDAFAEADLLREALEQIAGPDPKATLDEPDLDWEVVVKLRAIAKAAL